MNVEHGASEVLHLTSCSTVQQFHRSASHEVCHAILEYIRPVVKVGIFYSGNAFKAAFQCVPPTPETKEVVDEVP